MAMVRLFLMLVALWAGTGAAAAAPVRVYATASVADVVEAIAAEYARGGRARPVVVSAASPELARQIAAGAPGGVVLLADTAWMDWLAARGLVGPARGLLANRLALVVPTGTGPAGFDVAVLGGRWTTGDPDAVPLGRYTRAALTRLGVWQRARPGLVAASDARAALALVERGRVAAGVVYATDARAGRVRVLGLFPAGSHPPVVYPLALTRGAPVEAAAFAIHLRGPEAARAFRAAGFGRAR